MNVAEINEMNLTMKERLKLKTLAMKSGNDRPMSDAELIDLYATELAVMRSGETFREPTIPAAPAPAPAPAPRVEPTPAEISETRPSTKPVLENVEFTELTSDRNEIEHIMNNAVEQLAALREKERANEQRNANIDTDQLRELVAEIVNEEIQKPNIITVDRATREEIKRVNNVHSQFDQVMSWVTTRTCEGYRPNIWLYGEAGSGKTTLAKQASEALDLPFYTMGTAATLYDLVGAKNASGEFMETVVYPAYKNGGVLLLDESDASCQRALIALNQALANAFFTFPNGETVTKHKNFICFCCANTSGNGATATFNARNKMDAAFLNRFKKIELFTCDKILEDMMYNAYAANVVANHSQRLIEWLVTKAKEARAKCKELKYVNEITTRDCERAALSLAIDGIPDNAITELLAGFDGAKDQQKTLISALK